MGKNCPEKKEKCEAGAPKWMTTFSDLMSLLMCFFVLLLSFSEMDVARFKEVAGSLREAFGVQREEVVFEIPKGIDVVSTEFPAKFTVDEILERIKSAVKLELIKGEIQIESLKDRVVLRFKDGVLFAKGSAELTPRAKQILLKVGEVLELFDGEIIVAGHTDNTPVRNGRFRSNWELSAARAVSVVEFLLKHKFVLPRQLAAVGYGPSRPLYPNDTEEHRAANRRVEIILLQPKVPLLEYREAFSGSKEQEPIPQEAR
ncbi:MAG TPA: type VI secretion system protein TssL [Thermodesulfatator atlanticus]|uniref:Type VI secretion system protein TssL n=1 Tax=Thermodesulfatator atlanticus TaxID=501497 RepID=A0A7V5P0N9_9BACT|nr:type VI secretion system protein TssL [Thermodesulfatator atlanticus]